MASAERDLISILSGRLAGAGCGVARARDPEGAAAVVSDLMRGRPVATASSPLVDRVMGLVRPSPVCAPPDRAEVGVYEADLAVASTGTLVSSTGELDVRLVSTLPPQVVALLPAERVVESLEELLGGSREPFLALTTGPSSTGDIEGVLVVGVHGPAGITAVIIDEVEA